MSAYRRNARLNCAAALLLAAASPFAAALLDSAHAWPAYADKVAAQVEVMGDIDDWTDAAKLDARVEVLDSGGEDGGCMTDAARRIVRSRRRNAPAARVSAHLQIEENNIEENNNERNT